ncbi:hypothetical protein FRC11_014923, partial [Ceratobasidium sp. 423]
SSEIGALAPGSPGWVKQYSTGKLSITILKPERKAALDRAIASGRISMNVPAATLNEGAPSYRNSSGAMDPAEQPICSGFVKCKGAGQIYDMPDGIVGLSFNDGPLP